MMDKDVAEYLEDGGIGTVGTDIFAGYLPDASGTVVAVYQSRGYVPLMPVSVERPELHIVVRGTTSQAAMEKANDIYVYLHMKGEVTIETVRYLFFRALGSPGLMYADYSHDNPMFYVSIDFEVHKENE